jgi:streptomycin 6-kinase
VVVHGDLHHDNVLRSGRAGWLAIDPHGWVGDPGFDAGPLLYNPDPGRAADDLLAPVSRRVEQLADGMDVPDERVVRWGFVAAMLSEVWSAEDGEAGGRPLAVARLLHARCR